MTDAVKEPTEAEKKAAAKAAEKKAKEDKKAEEKAAADAKKAADKKAKEEAAAAAKASKPAADTKNGVTRPASGKTKQVWDVADQMSQELKAPVPRGALTERLLKEGLVAGTIHTQYGKWRKYHGLSAEKAAAAPAAPAQ